MFSCKKKKEYFFTCEATTAGKGARASGHTRDLGRPIVLKGEKIWPFDHSPREDLASRDLRVFGFLTFGWMAL